MLKESSHPTALSNRNRVSLDESCATACPRSVERMERASLSVKLFLSILALLLAESVNGLETKGVIG